MAQKKKDKVDAPKVIKNEEFEHIIAQTGNFYISGQPSEKGLEWLKKQGVTTIINIRTQAEMDNRDYVPYDEAQKAKEMGFQYIHVPMGRKDAPYSPKSLEKVAQAIGKAEGKVLLHCTVAWRASHVWAAYLVKYKKVPLNKAIDYAKAINFGTMPLEGLLGKDIILKLKK